jgi:outer membrane protein assembly factor BamA
LDYIGTVIGIGEDISTKDNLLFNQLYYGQYVKASVEGRYFIPLWPKGELVVRMLMGGALGYNQTKIVPPESRFFSGGTNSMRGWQSNTLGPGRLSLDSLDSGVANLLAPGGEWILEMNAELRFDLLSYLELAFFTDLGNVWFNDNEVTRTEIGPEAVLSGPNFRLGWDAGVGFRFDFSFLILRVDLGQQIYAPDKGWVFRNITRKSGVRTTQLNLGLGYPF